MCENTMEIQAVVENKVTADTKYLNVVKADDLAVVYPRQANAKDMMTPM